MGLISNRTYLTIPGRLVAYAFLNAYLSICEYAISFNLINSMKKSITFLVFYLAILSLSSCSAIAGIFKAGALVGIIAVVVAIIVIIWIISMFRGKSN
jgi:hypothetical protein